VVSEAPDNIDMWFAELLRGHLEAQLAPMIITLNALIGELVEQVNIREKVNRDYLEQNRELRVEVSKLAENVRAMRDTTSPAADMMN
jgi:hypothetical protein